jgi:signal transduction histidine kinase
MVSHCQAEARRIIWDLRESDHATPMLSEALSRTLSATATEDRIDMQLRVIGREVPLAQRYIHHLVCIGQEAVTNALRHAQPKTISIRLDYADRELKISVRDDGCGFRSSTSANVTLGHFGIPVMEERARKLGGTLQVETATGSGTEVLVSIPFQMPTLSAGAKA